MKPDTIIDNIHTYRKKEELETKGRWVVDKEPQIKYINVNSQRASKAAQLEPHITVTISSIHSTAKCCSEG
jgi:hypothetical protein